MNHKYQCIWCGEKFSDTTAYLYHVRFELRTPAHEVPA